MSDTQPSMFDTAPVQLTPDGLPHSRRTDPESSRIAAVCHREQATSNRGVILASLRIRDGQTGHELARDTRMSQVEVIRRLADLRNAGKVIDMENDVRCAVKPEAKQQRWWLTEAGR